MTVLKTRLAALRASMTPKDGECGAGMCCSSASCRDRHCPGHPVQTQARMHFARMERNDAMESRAEAGTKFLLYVALAFAAAGLWVLWGM